MLILFSSDIPLPLVTSGCENSGNLRELALNRMKDFGAVCRDVRFREVGVSQDSFLTFLSKALSPLSDPLGWDVSIHSPSHRGVHNIDPRLYLYFCIPDSRNSSQGAARIRRAAAP